MSGPLDLSLVERASLFDALRQAAESSGTGLAITDMSVPGQPRNLFVNVEMARMLGYELAEIEARDPWSMIAPEELPRLKELSMQAGQGNLPTSLEVVLLHKSGARLTMELAQSRTVIDGHPITVTLVHDVSSRTA